MRGNKEVLPPGIDMVAEEDSELAVAIVVKEGAPDRRSTDMVQ